jgi:hypothetical protein
LSLLWIRKEFDIQIPDDQAENIATVGQAISYIEEAKNNNLNTACFNVCGCYYFKIKIKIDFQSKDIYCNTHGSFVR